MWWTFVLISVGSFLVGWVGHVLYSRRKAKPINVITNLQCTGDIVQFDVDGELYATKLHKDDNKITYNPNHVYCVRTGYALDYETASRAFEMWSIRRSMNGSKIKKSEDISNFHALDARPYDASDLNAIMKSLRLRS